MAIEPIKGFYVHDEESNTDGVAKVSIDAVHEFVEDVSGTVENWLDEHPEATTAVQDGAIIESKINSSFLPSIKNAYVTPEMFEGTTDTEKLQASIDELETTGGVIVINRLYTLTSDLTTAHNSNLNNQIIILGIGKTAGLNFSGYCLKGRGASNHSGSYGGIVFDTLHLNGTETMINGDTLLRVSIRNCFIFGFKYVVKSTTGYLQTVYIENSFIRGVSEYVIYQGIDVTIDVRIDNCTIEWCGGALYCSEPSSVVINNNCIEGSYKPAIVIVNGSQTFSICDNYFETNDRDSGNGVSIDLSNITTGQMLNGNILRNSFKEFLSSYCSAIKLPTVAANSNSCLTIENNYSKNNYCGIVYSQDTSSFFTAVCIGNVGTFSHKNLSNASVNASQSRVIYWDDLNVSPELSQVLTSIEAQYAVKTYGNVTIMLHVKVSSNGIGAWTRICGLPNDFVPAQGMRTLACLQNETNNTNTFLPVYISKGSKEVTTASVEIPANSTCKLKITYPII